MNLEEQIPPAIDLLSTGLWIFTLLWIVKHQSRYRHFQKDIFDTVLILIYIFTPLILIGLTTSENLFYDSAPSFQRSLSEYRFLLPFLISPGMLMGYYITLKLLHNSKSKPVLLSDENIICHFDHVENNGNSDRQIVALSNRRVFVSERIPWKKLNIKDYQIEDIQEVIYRRVNVKSKALISIFTAVFSYIIYALFKWETDVILVQFFLFLPIFLLIAMFLFRTKSHKIIFLINGESITWQSKYGKFEKFSDQVAQLKTLCENSKIPFKEIVFNRYLNW